MKVASSTLNVTMFATDGVNNTDTLCSSKKVTHRPNMIVAYIGDNNSIQLMREYTMNCIVL